MDPAGHNLTSPYTSGYRDYYEQSITEDYWPNDIIIDSRSDYINVLKKVAISIACIIFIIGIIGNGLVIWIAGFRMKKTISAVWFLNLAIADFLCCASLPLYITGWAAVDMCTKSQSLEIFCLFDMILLNLSMSASVLLLTAMSVDRWVSVMWPIWAKVHRTQKLVRISAGIIWGLSFLWTGFIFYIIFDCSIGGCDTVKTLYVTNLVLMFVVPFLIIFTSYVTVFLKLRISKIPQRSQRPYRIITAVILGFFICSAPFNIWPLTSGSDGDEVQFDMVNIVITTLACLNRCINPIIYVLMGKQFRPSLTRSIPYGLLSALDEESDDPSEEQEDPQPAPKVDI